MNVIGEPIDERGPIKATKLLPIHAEAPEYVDQATSAEVLITGIKVVDLLAPYARGGKIGLFGGAGVGKTVFIQELIVCAGEAVGSIRLMGSRTISQKHMAVSPSLPVSANVLARVTTCTTKCRKPRLFSLMANPRSHWYSVR